MERALINMLLGMGTVFCVLILISLLIGCFQIFPLLEKKFQSKKAKTVLNENEPEEYAKEVLLAENELADYTLIAVISAAIAATNNCSTTDFVVRSIKRRNEIGE